MRTNNLYSASWTRMSCGDFSMSHCCQQQQYVVVHVERTLVGMRYRTLMIISGVEGSFKLNDRNYAY